ncbi:uncharacterized protein LOC126318360 [Schistocerca gregaria]|uniref:uncharacterized protein LOC126318360 n=1 Tax=Schistocerca gregaria TaxID=7010 RepID=UPI00211EF8DE|nr:uncharacterized protein LOC126318360 [Schistocerca gregaria]
MPGQDGEEGTSLAAGKEASVPKAGPNDRAGAAEARPSDEARARDLDSPAQAEAAKERVSTGEKVTGDDLASKAKAAAQKLAHRSDASDLKGETSDRKNKKHEASADNQKVAATSSAAQKSKMPNSTKKSGTKESSDNVNAKPSGTATTLGAKPATTLGGKTTLGARPPATTLGGAASMGARPKLPGAAGLKGVADVKASPTVTPSSPADARVASPSTPKQEAPKQEAPKPKMTALAARLRKQREERERLEQERIEKEKEAERLALEAEKRRVEEENRIREMKKAKRTEKRAQNMQLEAEKKKEQLIMQRKQLLAKFQGAYVGALQKDEDKKGGEKRKGATQKKKKPDKTEEKKRPPKKEDTKTKTEPVEPPTESAESTTRLHQAAEESGDQRLGEAPQHEEPEPVVQESWEDEFEDEPESPPPTGDAAPVCPPPTEPKQPTVPEDENPTFEEEAPETSSANADAPSGTSEPPLRSPICCVLGHVDTGKTKLLDRIRHTDVQTGEVGGITQQIGATYFPIESIQSLTSGLIKPNVKIDVPALLIIDTPGHASFSNLRHRGSSLCDIAILVIDILHGVEAMTVESIKLLRSKKTPFIVALNKVDRLYRWRAFQNKNIQYSLKMQEKTVLQEFEDKVSTIIQQLAQYNLNAELYYKVKNIKSLAKTVSLVPTSAHTGEGIPDLIYLLVQLTQRLMKSKLQLTNEFQCTVLEVKVSEGIGPNIDVILVSGSIHEGDRFVTCGFRGPIISTVRAILTPPPMRELRVHNHYTHNKVIHASQGFKIMANGLERAVAGSPLFVFKNESELPNLIEIVMKPLELLREKIHKASHGVYVQASTLGSLEALLDFLAQSCKIPIADFGIGPVHTRDVKLASIMLEKAPEYACILAFDVDISPSAQELAETLKVKIFHADIIYQLEEQFHKYISDYRESRRVKSISEAIFPCFLKIKPGAIFNTRNPIVVGVSVKQGILKKGTPIVVWSESKEEWLNLGNVTGIERDNKPIEQALAGEEASVSIKADAGQQYLFGRHLDKDSDLYSKITRASLDALKLHYPDIVKQNLTFLKQLKKLFEIEKGIPPST